MKRKCEFSQEDIYNKKITGFAKIWALLALELRPFVPQPAIVRLGYQG